MTAASSLQAIIESEAARQSLDTQALKEYSLLR